MKFPTRIYYTETDKALMWDRAHRPKTCKLVGDPVLGRVVAKKLKQFWSPEQIAGWLKYTYIDGRETPELTRLQDRSLNMKMRHILSSFAIATTLMSGPAFAQDDFSTVYVMSDNLGDMGFNDNAAAGFARVKEEGVKTRLLQASPTDPQLWRQNLEAVSNSGNWDVIFTGPNMHDNLAAVAPKNPDQMYVFFDDELTEPNVLSIKYAQNEGSYLAGALAAVAATDTENFPLSSGEAKIAIVAGMDLPIIQDFILGFKQGATTMVPDIKIQIIFIGNFDDAQKAYDLTRTAIENGANVVYNVAGPAGLGTLKAAADSDKYAIGVDSDQNGIHPDNVIASMLKQIGNSIYNSIEQIKAGEAEFGTVQVFGLEDEGVALIYNDTIVPEQVKAQIEAAEAKVTSGEIEVDSAF